MGNDLLGPRPLFEKKTGHLCAASVKGSFCQDFIQQHLRVHLWIGWWDVFGVQPLINKTRSQRNATVEQFSSGENGEWMLDYEFFLESSLSHYQQKQLPQENHPQNMKTTQKQNTHHLGKVLKLPKKLIFSKKMLGWKNTSRILNHQHFGWRQTFAQPGDTTSIEGWSTAQGQLLGQDLALWLIEDVKFERRFMVNMI